MWPILLAEWISDFIQHFAGHVIPATMDDMMQVFELTPIVFD